MAKWQDAPAIDTSPAQQAHSSTSRWRSAPAIQSPQPSQQPATRTEGVMRRLGLKDAAIGAADVAISGARGLVNKPALTAQALAHGAIGAINPSDTFRDAYARSQTAGRADIESGRGLVGSERLRTPQGAQLAGAVGQLPGIRHIGQGIEWAGQKIEDFAGPETRDVVESAATLATLRAPRMVAAQSRPALTAEEVAARSRGGDSVGASAAAVDLNSITPDLRQAIVAGGQSGRPVSREALSRHVEADTLPIPIRLTAGEALQDPVLLSQERNLRGKHPQMVERMAETNRSLAQNLQAVRDEIGDRVFSTNPVEHGDTLIATYKRMDAAAEAEISGLYRQLREASGSHVPIDAGKLWDNVQSALHRDLLFDHAPPEVMTTLRRLADSRQMTFQNFEALRTNLARIQRSSQDGNARAAARVIRNQLEELPIFPGSGLERLKPIADAARAAARRRFQALEADPAYEAAVNGTVPPDRFVQKFIVGAPRDQLAATMRNLQSERATVGVAVLDHLRDAARLDPNYGGNFSAAGYARALQALDPKANLIFDSRTAETLGKLRNVAGYTTFQPRGSFVNNSNTLVGAAAKYGAHAAEGATNFAFGGIPVGTWVRSGIESAGTRRLIQNSLKQGAGLNAPKNALARSRKERNALHREQAP